MQIGGQSGSFLDWMKSCMSFPVTHWMNSQAGSFFLLRLEMAMFQDHRFALAS